MLTLDAPLVCSPYRLGSITHLQHQFARHSAPSKKSRAKPPPKGGVALPSLGGPPSLSLAEVDDELYEEDAETPGFSPPPPPPPPKIQFQEFERPPGFKELRSECWAHLDTVCEQWKLVEYSKKTPTILSESGSSALASPTGSPVLSPQGSPQAGARRLSGGNHRRLSGGRTESPHPIALPSADHLVLDLLHGTTEAIRAVQRFILAHPDSDASLNARLSSINLRPASRVDNSLDQRHQSQLGVSTAARPRISSAQQRGPSTLSPHPRVPSASNASQDGDKINDVRKSCLELLGVLQDMEKKQRLDNHPQAEEAAAAANNTKEEVETSTEGDSFERSGHLYQDVTLEDLSKEREDVRKWVQQVDDLLRASLTSTKVKSGKLKDTDEGITIHADPAAAADVEELPAWASLEAYPGAPLRMSMPYLHSCSIADMTYAAGRAHALLTEHIPSELIFNLQPPFGEDGSREGFLESLSDGQLVCLAFNAALKESARPWGYIPPETIHDVIALAAEQSQVSTTEAQEASGAPRVGLTFRRLENIRVWTAGLKLRYEVVCPFCPV